MAKPEEEFEYVNVVFESSRQYYTYKAPKGRLFPGDSAIVSVRGVECTVEVVEIIGPKLRKKLKFEIKTIRGKMVKEYFHHDYDEEVGY